MSASSDLIDYFRLNVSFDSADTNITIETVETSDRAKGLRQVRTVKRWKKIKAIGQGSFGAVWLEHADGNSETQRAVKEISKGNGTSMSVFNVDYNRELVALGRLSKHQDVFVDFHGWYENDQSVFLAMEYFNYGDLGQYITQDLKERDTQEIAKQLLQGLAILHQQNWAHRDLKPQNIFVVSPSPYWWVKIGDFGISRRLREDETKTNIGTLNYAAPEIMGYIDDGADSEEEEHGKADYTVAVDMWSLGCVLYQMLALTLPFPTPKKLASYCRSKKPNFPLGPLQQRAVSEEGCQCMQQLMTSEPSKRLTASAALKTKWVSEAEHHGIKTDPAFYTIGTRVDENLGLSETDPVTVKAGVSMRDLLGLENDLVKINAWIGASPVATLTLQPLSKQTDTSKPQQPNGSTSSPRPQKDLLSPYNKELGPSWAVALRDYEKNTNSELGFKKGDVLQLLDYDRHRHSDWWTAMNNKKVKGIVPHNYISQNCQVAYPRRDQKPERYGEIELFLGCSITDITISSENTWTGTNHFGDRGEFPRHYVWLDLSHIGPAPI